MKSRHYPQKWGIVFRLSQNLSFPKAFSYWTNPWRLPLKAALPVLRCQLKSFHLLQASWRKENPFICYKRLEGKKTAYCKKKWWVGWWLLHIEWSERGSDFWAEPRRNWTTDVLGGRHLRRPRRNEDLEIFLQHRMARERTWAPTAGAQVAVVRGVIWDEVWWVRQGSDQTGLRKENLF